MKEGQGDQSGWPKFLISALQVILGVVVGLSQLVSIDDPVLSEFVFYVAIAGSVLVVVLGLLFGGKHVGALFKHVVEGLRYRLRRFWHRVNRLISKLLRRTAAHAATDTNSGPPTFDGDQSGNAYSQAILVACLIISVLWPMKDLLIKTADLAIVSIVNEQHLIADTCSLDPPTLKVTVANKGRRVPDFAISLKSSSLPYSSTATVESLDTDEEEAHIFHLPETQERTWIWVDAAVVEQQTFDGYQTFKDRNLDNNSLSQTVEIYPVCRPKITSLSVERMGEDDTPLHIAPGDQVDVPAGHMVFLEALWEPQEMLAGVASFRWEAMWGHIEQDPSAMTSAAYRAPERQGADSVYVELHLEGSCVAAAEFQMRIISATTEGTSP